MPLFLFIYFASIQYINSFYHIHPRSEYQTRDAMPTELRRTLLSYAAPLLSYAATYWSTQHLTELRRIVPSYAAPAELRYVHVVKFFYNTEFFLLYCNAIMLFYVELFVLLKSYSVFFLLIIISRREYFQFREISELVCSLKL